MSQILSNQNGKHWRMDALIHYQTVSKKNVERKMIDEMQNTK